MSNKYLLEIGVEELPARFVSNTLTQMKNYTEKLLNEERIPFEEMSLYSTPRRLVIIIDGLPERQANLEGLVKGPSKKIAFDNEGNPTKALQGFLRGQSATIDEIFTKEYNGEEYV